MPETADRYTSPIKLLSFILTCMIISLFLFSSVSFAKKKKVKKKKKYKVIEVVDGGSISGRALYTGSPVPDDETVHLTSQQELMVISL